MTQKKVQIYVSLANNWLGGAEECCIVVAVFESKKYKVTSYHCDRWVDYEFAGLNLGTFKAVLILFFNRLKDFDFTKVFANK
jgi:hypothetical protein